MNTNMSFPTFAGAGRAIGRGAVWFLRHAWKPALLILLLFAVVHTASMHMLGGEVEAELRRIRAEGDPVSARDLRPKGIPDSDNGAVVYERVIRLLSKRDAAKDMMVVESWDWSGGKPAADPGELRRALARLQPVVDLIAVAADRPHCRFAIEWERGMAALMPQYARMRAMARLVSAAAIASAEDGDMGTAVRYASLGLKLSESMREEPGLISALVRVAMLKITTGAIARLASDLSLRPSQVGSLYDELGRIDLSPGLANALKGERALLITVFDDIRKRGFRFAEWGVRDEEVSFWLNLRTKYLGKPLFYSDEVRCLKSMRETIDGVGKPYSAAPTWKDDDGSASFEECTSLTEMLVPAYRGAFGAAASGQAEANGVQTLMALIAYKSRFGAYPDSLAQIEPQLAWQIRKDPFDGENLKYRREADGCVVYSVGANLKDDGGTPPAANEDRHERGDIVWRLRH